MPERRGLDHTHQDVLVDWDDTLYDHVSGGPEKGVKEALERFRAAGLRVVISSARTSRALYTPEQIQKHVVEMRDFLKQHDIPFDEIDDGTQGKRPRRAYIGNEAIAYRRRRNWAEIGNLVVPLPGLHLIAMMGFPGSGKSTFSRKLITDDGSWARVNLDEVSAMIGGPYNELRRVYHRAELEVIRSAFENGKNVLVDRTNMSREKRSRWSTVAREYGAKATIAFVSVPVELYRERNETRKGTPTYVDESAYQRHWESFEFPNLQHEDYDELIIVDENLQTDIHQIRKPNGEIVNLAEPHDKEDA